MESKNFEYVGFWKRVGAGLLDCIFFIPFIIIFMKTNRYFIENKMIFPMISYYFTVFAYQLFFIIRFGGTPGKLIMKYKIVNKNGEFLTLKQGLLRLLLYFPSSIIFIFTKFIFTEGLEFKVLNIVNETSNYIALVDCIFVVFNKRKRAIHDYMAGSFVVTEKSRMSVNG